MISFDIKCQFVNDVDELYHCILTLYRYISYTYYYVGLCLASPWSRLFIGHKPFKFTVVFNGICHTVVIMCKVEYFDHGCFILCIDVESHYHPKIIIHWMLVSFNHSLLPCVCHPDNYCSHGDTRHCFVGLMYQSPVHVLLLTNCTEMKYIYIYI